ncbi:hypothetical protein JCM19239_4913 [Vibrio variabilis]|uniref:Uncharacterized protein n=1 Tax=Vibrio variabilis TaxID=990271 RepID=A0ABQ0JBB2_9VIBR|nr:hypothetical protein JCM19239_4913 [Vibrio variabilis]
MVKKLDRDGVDLSKIPACAGMTKLITGISKNGVIPAQAEIYSKRSPIHTIRHKPLLPKD